MEGGITHCCTAVGTGLIKDKIKYQIYPNNKQDMPNSGMFMSNCAHHVTLANPTTWSAMPVPTIDSNDQPSVTLNQVGTF